MLNKFSPINRSQLVDCFGSNGFLTFFLGANGFVFVVKVIGGVSCFGCEVSCTGSATAATGVCFSTTAAVISSATVLITVCSSTGVTVSTGGVSVTASRVPSGTAVSAGTAEVNTEVARIWVFSSQSVCFICFISLMKSYCLSTAPST